MVERAIWLRRIGDYVVVFVEAGGKWVEVIREHYDGPISHIVEPSGITACIAAVAIETSEKDLQASGGIVRAP